MWSTSSDLPGKKNKPVERLQTKRVQNSKTSFRPFVDFGLQNGFAAATIQVLLGKKSVRAYVSTTCIDVLKTSVQKYMHVLSLDRVCVCK